MNYQPQHPLEPGAHSEPNEARRKHELERGQAIVLIAFVMVGLIAMLGLSVDGGGLLFLYRDARNATDAATLAAAYARCTNGDLEEAGKKTAADNGFNNNGTQNRVFVDNPPLDGVGAGDENYIKVKIEAFKPSYFIQIVYPEPLWITTEATGYCREAFDTSNVGAIFGISPNCGYSVDMTGADTTITGDIFSNDSTRIQGSNSGGRLKVDGNLDTVDSFAIDKVDVIGDGHVATNGVEARDNPFGWFSMDDYRPGGIIWEALEENYSGYLNHEKGDWKPDKKAGPYSGLYVVEGDVDINGIEADTSIGLTIIAKGNIKMSNPPAHLRYFEPLLTLDDIDIPSIGIVLYSENGAKGCSNGQSDIALSISPSQMKVTGVVYTPNGVLSASFSKTEWKGALIGWLVNLAGSERTITHDPTLFPPQPPRVSIAQ